MLLAMLLFAQLATAAYACPAWQAAQATEARMPGCDGMMGDGDPDQPNLCRAHGEAGAPAMGDPGFELPPCPHFITMSPIALACATWRTRWTPPAG